MALAHSPGRSSPPRVSLMARGPRLQKITVSLLEPHGGGSEALRDRGDLVGRRVPGIDRERDVLFVASSPPHPPRWKAYLAPHVTGPIDDIYTASASGVLLFEASGRLFAVTFGGGRHL